MEFNTIITGAGISGSRPSSLPSGDQLAGLAWDLANYELHALSAKKFAESKRRIGENGKGLRLEQLLNVMARHVRLSDLVSVYDTLDSEAYNFDHAALQLMGDADHFTLNMDRLLEVARDAYATSASITHLHGEYSHHSSIVTTIDQYLDGLSPKDEQRLGRALHGKSVLVAGYSGRDRDVLPMFLKYPPKRLVWLIFPLADYRDDITEDAELTNEVRLMLRELKSHPDNHDVDSPRQTTEAFILERIAPPSGRLAELLSLVDPTRPPERADWTLPPSAIEAIETNSRPNRILAVAAVLFELGMSSTVISILRWRQVAPENRITRRKLLGRARVKMGHPRRALLTFVAPIPGVARGIQMRSVANEVANVLTSAGFPRLAERADARILAEGEGDTSAQAISAVRGAHSRHGQRLNLRGDYQGALDEFAMISGSAVPLKQQGLGNLVDAWTWTADVYKILGDYAEAKKWAARANYELQYSNASQRAWAMWKLAEVELLASDDRVSSDRDLRKALDYAVASGDSAAEYWARLTLVGCIGDHDPRSAWAMLAAADRVWRTPRADALLFRCLQAAELSRVEGSFAQSIRWATKALRIERDRRRLPHGCASGKLAAKLIAATCAAERAHNPTARGSASAELSRIAGQYRNLGANAAAVHAEISAAVAGGEKAGPDTLATINELHLVAETARLARGDNALLPQWQVVM